MENRNYSNQSFSRIDETIQSVFKQSGGEGIPDVRLICSLTKTDRQTVMSHLQKWWRKHDFLNQNEVFLSEVCEFKKSCEEEITLLQNHMDSLIHELELHSDSLNQASDFSYPVGNYLIQSMLNIQQKLDFLQVRINENEKLQSKLATELSEKSEECQRLSRTVNTVNGHSKKKIAEVRQDLEKSRHEIHALRGLIKSLKKNKKHASPLRCFYTLPLK